MCNSSQLDKQTAWTNQLSYRLRVCVLGVRSRRHGKGSRDRTGKTSGQLFSAKNGSEVIVEKGGSDDESERRHR